MKKIFVFGFIVLLAANGFSQDFSMDQVKQLVETNGKSYLQPLVTGYGSAMNAGLFNTARTHKMLGFDISFKTGIGIVPTGEQSTYNFDISALDNIPVTVGDYTLDLDPSQLFSNTETPTILGGKAKPFEVDQMYIESIIFDQARANIINQTPNQTDAWYDDQAQAAVDAMSDEISDVVDDVAISSIPGIKSIDALKNLDNIIFPFPIIQASIGLPMGIEPSIRLIPAISIPGDVGDALGEISAFGAGLKIDLVQFIPIPLFPVDIAAQAYYQNFKMGDILSSNNVNFNIHASKKLLMFTPYVGIGVDNTSFTASYDTGDGEKQDFTIKGDNKLRTTVGLNIKLLVLQINAEYAMGEYNSAAIGVGFTLR
ncbi:hypothetical protein KJ762_05845 [bacterium]|nr:hypothetical protein [bacterium]MBU1065606.1 hypothetical protein [bacterium]MBU1634017.1 hypothetical protein [bacterium]MBU1872568.1 hypothetical protein [bacterium]